MVREKGAKEVSGVSPELLNSRVAVMEMESQVRSLGHIWA